MNNYLIYLRKSQKDSPDESVAEVLRKHEIQLQEYAEKTLGYKIPEECIFREVVSGETIEARTEIKKVLTLIEQPHISGVIVIEPQRLGRGDLQDCGALVNAFRYSHTLVMTPSKTYDLSDKFDRKFFEMELQRGSDYLEYYKEIQARGRIASVKRGNYIGSVPPYGYKKIWIKDSDGRDACTLEIVPEEADAVRLMFDLYANHGYGFQKIAYTLIEMGIPTRKGGLWTPAGIKPMLNNPIYIGKVCWNRRKTIKVMKDGALAQTRPRNTDSDDVIICDGKHPAIVDEDLFNRVQHKRSNNPRVHSYVEVRNYFSGILFCRCGRAMVMRPYYKKGHGGVKESAEPRILCPNQKICDTGSALYSQLHEHILNILHELLAETELTIDSSDDNISYLTNKIELIKKNIEHLEAKELSLWEKYTEEQMPRKVFDGLRKKNAAALTAAREALTAAESELNNSDTIINRSSTIEAALDALEDDSVPAELKNNLLKACIKRITYSRARPVRAVRGQKGKSDKVVSINGWVESPIELDVELRF